ncbi:MAG: DUF2478 domain-containing protein [Pseudomonadota bacterium]
MTPALLAAVQFENQDVDRFLGRFASDVAARGLRVSGVVQTRGDASGECHCADMDLTSLSSGRLFRISQPLGNGSRGCRLHPGALAECAAHLQAEIDRGTDLLVLNRFGRGESEGRGFRDLIGYAMQRDIPVLTAVRATYRDAWDAFAGDAAVTLPLSSGAVSDWFETSMRFEYGL